MQSDSSLRPDVPRPSERLPEPHSGTYEVWIKTKELGWFRSAIRATREAAEELANVLRANFEVEVR